MGILMIIFASLGLLFGLIGLAGSGINKAAAEGIPALKTWMTLSMVFGVVGLGVSALHLFTGVRAVGYKSNAPKLAVMYAAINMGLSLLQLILIFAWLKPAIAKVGGIGAEAAASAVGGIAVFFTILALIWPTLVLILMTRPGAKQSCVN
jgi:hypothetical protein